MTDFPYTVRRVALVTIEAITPFRVGIGEENHLSDSPVMTDANDLPCIPGSSIRGVLRHNLLDHQREYCFLLGESAPKGSSNDTGHGSRLRISHAVVLDANGAPVVGLRSTLDGYLTQLTPEFLPRREHVRIGDTGTAEDKGKFDEMIVPRGVRLQYEMELLDTEGSGEAPWESFLHIITEPGFRLGSGSRRGFGLFRIVACNSRTYQLRKALDMEAYASRPYMELEGGTPHQHSEGNRALAERVVSIQPRDFWLFSQGYGDTEYATVPAREKTVKWENDKATLNESFFIPASGLKGAIAHRLAYHYNRIRNIALTGEANPGVTALFGSARGEQGAAAGKVLFQDIFIDIPQQAHEQVFQHVSIDRFTQKAMDKALFNERVLSVKEPVSITLQYPEDTFADPDIRTAFECTLFDIEHGLLPLGSLTGRGFGAMEKTS